MINNKNQIKTTEGQQRLNELGQVSSIINRMQNEITQQQSKIDKDSNTDKQMQNATIKMLGSISNTINQVGHGMKNVAIGTVETGKDAISQYSKSITKDINIDKQNIVAMALSKTSPLFGYFASKFMETDVFKNTATRIKINLGNAIGSVASNFKDKFKGFFNKKSKNVTENVLLNKKIPKLQHGGYIEKGGVAKLHSAEVVMPIEKVLKRIDDSNEVSRKLVDAFQNAQFKTSLSVMDYNKKTETFQKVGIIKGFSKALHQSYDKYTIPANDKLLRAVIGVQDSMGATVGKWSLVWKKMFAEHPTFRNMVLSLKAIGSIIGIPYKIIYSIFKTRGGYKGHLSHSKNPMQATAENVGLVYTGGMWRLDNIAKFTRATAEATRDLSTAITGRKYPQIEGIGTGITSIFGSMRKAANVLGGATFRTAGKLIGGKEFGEKLSEQVTRKRYLLRSKRDRELDKIYGSSNKDYKNNIGSINIGEIIQISNNNIIKSIDKLSLISSNCCNLTQKKNQKLLTYTNKNKNVNEKNLSIQKKMNKRDRLQALLSKFGFKKIAAMVSLFTTFVVPFLFGGGMKQMFKSIFVQGTTLFGLNMIKKFLPKWALTGLKKLIPFSLKFITKLTPLIVMFTKKLLPILSKLAGPITMLASAGIIGWKIGKGIDKFIGVSDKFEKTLQKYDEKANRSAKILNEQQAVIFKKATNKKEFTQETFKAKRELKMQTLLGAASPKRRKNVGYFGRANIYAINIAQQKYMNDHINDYLKYSYNEIRLQREMWLKKGYSGKSIGIDSEQYGYRREKSFLYHLKKHGNKLSKEQLQKLYTERETKWKQYNKESLLESIPSRIKGTVDYTKNIAVQATAQGTKIASEMVKQGKQAIERTKEISKTMVESVSNINNTITSANINNTTNNGSNQESPAKFSETTKAIMQGA